MRLGLMQPYIFPYIGYYQLIKVVDKFIVYDDVTFIKQGWINRNNILLNQRAHLFTIPLVNASSNTLICDTLISDKINWKPKFLKTLEQAYKKAPFYKPVRELVERVVMSNDPHMAIMAADSIKSVMDYLNIATTFIPTSRNYKNAVLTSKDRVIDICKKENATTYINLVGGQALYDKEIFKKYNLELYFIKAEEVSYPQYGESFAPWLSIIDVLMFNSPENAMNFLDKYELI